MRDRLVEMGIWMVQNPKQVAQAAILIWSVATIGAGIWLWQMAKKDTAPKAPGLKHRRVS